MKKILPSFLSCLFAFFAGCSSDSDTERVASIDIRSIFGDNVECIITVTISPYLSPEKIASIELYLDEELIDVKYTGGNTFNYVFEDIPGDNHMFIAIVKLVGAENLYASAQFSLINDPSRPNPPWHQMWFI